MQHARFLLQQHHFQQVADRFRMRNDVVAHRARRRISRASRGPFPARRVRSSRDRSNRHRAGAAAAAATVRLSSRRAFPLRKARRNPPRRPRARTIPRSPPRGYPSFAASRCSPDGTRTLRPRERAATRHGVANTRRDAVASDSISTFRSRANSAASAYGSTVRRAPRPAARRHHAVPEPLVGACHQPRIHADQRAPIRLIDAMRRLVGRCIGERLQRVARTGRASSTPTIPRRACAPAPDSVRRSPSPGA